MYPIGIVLALGLAIAVERYIYLSASRTANQRMWKRLVPLLQSGNFNQASAAIAKSRSAISRILSYGIARIRTSNSRADVETAMEEGLMEIVSRLEKRTHYLAAFANIATLLGLLGTIMGLIGAFTAVGNAEGAARATELSAQISLAMNTTAFGLMVAIPLLLMYSVLQSKTTEIVDSLEMASVKFLNTLADARARTAAQ